MSWGVASLLFVFTLFGAGIAAATLNDYKTPQGRQLGMVLVSSSAASFAYGMEIISPGLTQKFFWVVVRYFALIVFTFATALFVFYLTHISIRFRSWRFLVLCLPPAVILFFLATYPLTHLVYDRIWLDTSGPIPMIEKTVGPLYWVLNFYIMGVLGALIYLVLNNMSRGSNLNRGQSRIMAAALGLVMATHLLHLGGVSLLGVLNPNLFFYFPAAALILWGSKRYRLADIRPIAHNLLFSQMQDGILVIDRQHNLIDINPAAERYLKIFQRNRIGMPLKSSADELAGLLADHTQGKKAASILDLHGIPMQVTFTPLVMRGEQNSGYLIILRDIGDRVEAERLKEMEIKRQTAWVERQKIARTLHDSISQYLNSLVMLSRSARQRLDQEKYRQLDPVITHITTSARQASQEMRALINELQLESPSDQGFDLIQAINERLSLVEGQGELQVQLDAPETLELDSTRQREIFYILLEALNNILQHARADRVSICLRQADGQFTAEISDNGCGFDPQQIRAGGMGLANMRERARQIGGQLSIEGNRGSGARLGLVLPLGEQTLNRAGD
jgi:signal transduction histidine kinase